MADWQQVRARKQEIDRAAGRDVETARARAKEHTDAYVLGYRLSSLREQAGLSQKQVAERMGVKQPRVSAIEKGGVTQMELETIRRYVAALGGRLRLVAGFDDHDEVVSTTMSGPEERATA
ncbi:helix-turn-helix domain-containing protein [Saccharomonospora halophila]|uniref:helix-turn-helix domain-containing protein n=1 Tax=Saccharomonospora halophila TaxID=129922 RepID=UPI000381DB44|nr:XRE family transcriptional regulator [Saccharomonospora halophila]